MSAEDAPFVARPISISRAYEQLAGQIRGRILAGELAEGDRLPSELALARDAGVSRGTVREALRLLEEAGFVERASPRILVVRHPRGEEPAVREVARALKQSDVTFDDVHEALLALDPPLTRLATEKADAAQIEALERHLRGAGARALPARDVEPPRRRVPPDDRRDRRQRSRCCSRAARSARSCCPPCGASSATSG